MAKVIITFSELRASMALVKVVAETINVHLPKEVNEKKIAELGEFCNKSDREVAAELRSFCNEVDHNYVFVGSREITVDIPEEFIVGYLAAYGKMAGRVIPVGVQVYNALKALKGIFKAFEKDVVALCRDVLGVKPIPQEANKE